MKSVVWASKSPNQVKKEARSPHEVGCLGVKIKEICNREVQTTVQLKENLESRSKYIEDLIKMLTSRLSENIAVENIYAKKHRNGFQYYIETDEGLKYVKISERKHIQQMIQYEYERKVLRSAKEEYKKINALMKVYDNSDIEDIYNQMPAGKRVMVNPIKLTDEEYIKWWNEQQYERLAFREGAPEFYSSKGERMRSKSEVLIADLLNKMNINYKYEKPLELSKLGLVHPDFTLLDVKNRKEIYLEHLGMMDDQVYRNNAITKIRDYERSGYYMGDRLLITMETVNCPIDMKAIEQEIIFIMKK